MFIKEKVELSWVHPKRISSRCTREVCLCYTPPVMVGGICLCPEQTSDYWAGYVLLLMQRLRFESVNELEMTVRTYECSAADLRLQSRRTLSRSPI